jgi:hypothetical protein
VKDHLIHNGRDVRFQVWRGLDNRDSLNEEWEEESKVPNKKQSQKLDSRMNIQGMVVNAFQQVDELVSLKERVMDIVEEAFRVDDGLHYSSNEGNNSNGEGVAPFDHEGQQSL